MAPAGQQEHYSPLDAVMVQGGKASDLTLFCERKSQALVGQVGRREGAGVISEKLQAWS